MNQITLENERVLLEPLDLSHLAKLLPIALKDRDLLEFSPVPFGDEQSMMKYIEKALREKSENKRWAFAVFDKLVGKYAGSTSFMMISEPNRVIEIGSTWIGRDFQGTGLNINMKGVMINYLLEDLGYERVEFKTDERNVASRRALEKIGAKFEGVWRAHIVMLDGFRRSSAYYSILKHEWPEVKTTFFSEISI